MDYGLPIGKRSVFVLAVFMAALAMMACSGGDGFLGETFPMDQAGGTITYSEPSNPGVTVTLDFPAGAVPNGTNITIRSVTGFSDPNVIGGLVFDFGPDGIIFANPVQLVISYNPAALGGLTPDHLRIHKRVGTTWLELPTAVDTVAHTLTTSLNGFSMYAGFPEIAPPITTASPTGGTYGTVQSVTLTCDDGGAGSGCAGTYYTMDGSTPTPSSTPYTTPIDISVDTVLKFFSVDNAGNEEAVNTESYIITTVPPTFTVGGNVTGLTSTLVLQNNGGDDLALSLSGPFTFATPLQASETYLVTVLTQPPGQTCNISNGSGTIAGTNITNVTVTCFNSPPVNAPPVNTTAANFINNGASSTTSLDLSLAISATDDVGVVAYIVQETNSATPSPSDPGWVAVTPTASYSATVNHTYTSDTTAGNKTVYVFFKDAQDAVSSGVGDDIAYSTVAPQGQLITFEEYAAQYLGTQYASRGVTFTFSDSIVAGQHHVPYVEWWSWGPAGNKAWLCNDKVSNSYITGVIHILLTTPAPEVRFVIYQNLDIVIHAFAPGGAQLPDSVVTRVDRSDTTYGAVRDVTIQNAGGIQEVTLLASPGVVFVDALSY